MFLVFLEFSVLTLTELVAYRRALSINRNYNYKITKPIWLGADCNLSNKKLRHEDLQFKSSLGLHSGL